MATEQQIQTIAKECASKVVGLSTVNEFLEIAKRIIEGESSYIGLDVNDVLMTLHDGDEFDADEENASPDELKTTAMNLYNRIQEAHPCATVNKLLLQLELSKDPEVTVAHIQGISEFFQEAIPADIDIIWGVSTNDSIKAVRINMIINFVIKE